MIILCLIQHFLVSRWVIFGATADILTIFTAFTSMTLGQRTGTTYGFAAGILTGFLTGNIGLSALARTIEGFSAGFFHVPEHSHATSVKKRRMLYLSVLTALVCGNIIQSILSNPLSLPLALRIVTLVVIGTALTMLPTVIVYHLFLKKILTD